MHNFQNTEIKYNTLPKNEIIQDVQAKICSSEWCLLKQSYFYTVLFYTKPVQKEETETHSKKGVSCQVKSNQLTAVTVCNCVQLSLTNQHNLTEWISDSIKKSVIKSWT